MGLLNSARAAGRGPGRQRAAQERGSDNTRALLLGPSSMETVASLSARCIAGRRSRPCRARPAVTQAGGAPRRESQPSRPRRSVVALAAEGESERASAEAYNRAMQAYSQSPFTYQHEAGLCARHAPPAPAPTRTRAARAPRAHRAARCAQRRRVLSVSAPPAALRAQTTTRWTPTFSWVRPTRAWPQLPTRSAR